MLELNKQLITTYLKNIEYIDYKLFNEYILKIHKNTNTTNYYNNTCNIIKLTSRCLVRVHAFFLFKKKKKTIHCFKLNNDLNRSYFIFQSGKVRLMIRYDHTFTVGNPLYRNIFKQR